MILEPTAGQIERQLSQGIQNFYSENLGTRPSKVTCQFFDEKLAIALEDTVTKVEKTLIDNGQIELAAQLRLDLDKTMQPQLKELIETILPATILALISGTSIETGHTGIIVFLKQTPEVRNPQAIPKVKPFLLDANKS